MIHLWLFLTFLHPLERSFEFKRLLTDKKAEQPSGHTFYNIGHMLSFPIYTFANCLGDFAKQFETTESLSSVTRWLYFFNVWPFTTLKISQISPNFAKVGSALCQIRNKLSKIYQRLETFAKVCKISHKSGHTVTLSDFAYRDTMTNVKQNSLLLIQFDMNEAEDEDEAVAAAVDPTSFNFSFDLSKFFDDYGDGNDDGNGGTSSDFFDKTFIDISFYDFSRSKLYMTFRGNLLLPLRLVGKATSEDQLMMDRSFLKVTTTPTATTTRKTTTQVIPRPLAFGADNNDLPKVLPYLEHSP